MPLPSSGCGFPDQHYEYTAPTRSSDQRNPRTRSNAADLRSAVAADQSWAPSSQRRPSSSVARVGLRERLLQQGAKRLVVAPVEAPVVAQIGAGQRRTRRPRSPAGPPRRGRDAPAPDARRRSPARCARSRTEAASAGQSPATLFGSAIGEPAPSGAGAGCAAAAPPRACQRSAAWHSRASASPSSAVPRSPSHRHSSTRLTSMPMALLQLEAGGLDPGPAVERDRIVPERLARPGSAIDRDAAHGPARGAAQRRRAQQPRIAAGHQIGRHRRADSPRSAPWRRSPRETARHRTGSPRRLTRPPPM